MAELIHLHQRKNPKSMTMTELRRYAGDKVPGSGRHRKYRDANRRIQALTNGDISLLHPWYNGDHVAHWLIDRRSHIFFLSYVAVAREMETAQEEICPYCANTPLDLRRFGSEQLLIDYTLKISGGGAVIAPGQELLGIDDVYTFFCLKDRCYYGSTFRYYHLDSQYNANCPICESRTP